MNNFVWLLLRMMSFVPSCQTKQTIKETSLGFCLGFVHDSVSLSETIVMGYPYLIGDIFIIADVVLEGHDRLPWIILGVYTTTGGFTVLVSCYCQRIPMKNKQIWPSYVTCITYT